jgi:putative transcriptional regulator
VALSNDIRRYRFDYGEMSQKALAELIGVSRQTMNAIESGKSPPALDVAFRIARVFGRSIEDVFTYEGDTVSEHANNDGVIIDVYWDKNDESGKT